MLRRLLITAYSSADCLIDEIRPVRTGFGMTVANVLQSEPAVTRLARICTNFEAELL